MILQQVATEIAGRLGRLFLPEEDGRRPADGADARFAADPHWRGLLRFPEYFDGDTGRGVGASHQTGWTGLVSLLIADQKPRRSGAPDRPQQTTVAGNGDSPRPPVALSKESR